MEIFWIKNIHTEVYRNISLFPFIYFLFSPNYLHGIRGRRQLEFRTTTDEENLDRLERGLHEYKLTAEENEKKYSEVNIKCMHFDLFFLTEVDEH